MRLVLLLLLVSSCYPNPTTPFTLKQPPSATPPPTPTTPLSPPALLDLLGASWRWRSPHPQGNSLYGLYADPAGSLYSVGRFGTILRADPSWELLESGSREWLFGVWGSGSALFVVGANGALLRSLDRGDTWVSKAPKTREFLFSGASLPSGESFVVGSGGVIFSSSDQGETWRSLRSTTQQSLYQILATPAGVLFAVGEGGLLLRSVDKVNWSKVELGITQDLYSLYAEGERLYLVGDQGLLLSSLDAGETFTSQRLSSQRLNSIWGRDEALWVVGNNGLLLRSLDAGKTWQTVPIHSQYHLFAVRAARDGALVAVGSLGLMLTSTDQGASWSSLSSGPQRTLYAAQITASPRGWEYIFVGAVGAVYQVRPISIGSFEEYTRAVTWANFRALVALSSGELIAVSEQGGVFRSVKGDERWVFQATTAPLSAMVGDAARLTAAGAAGQILLSFDRGKTWRPEDSGVTSDLTGLWQSPQGARFAVGDKGTLLRAKPKEAWKVLSVPTSARLHAVWGADESHLFLAGERGVLLRSQDGGDTWQTLSSGTAQHLYGLWGVSASDLYVVGAAGTILHSKDAGDSWAKEPSPTDRHLYFIVGSPSGELFAGGEAGALLLSSWVGGE